MSRFSVTRLSSAFNRLTALGNWPDHFSLAFFRVPLLTQITFSVTPQVSGSEGSTFPGAIHHELQTGTADGGAGHFGRKHLWTRRMLALLADRGHIAHNTHLLVTGQCDR